MLDLSKYPKFSRDSRLVKRLGFLEIEWRRACPDVDLKDQLGWAHYWILTNAKGAHYTDMVRFLSSWFKRCQRDSEEARKKGGPIQMPKKYVEPAPAGEVMDAEDFARMKEAIGRKSP